MELGVPGGSATVIVTSCGKRKCIEPHPRLRGSALGKGDVVRLSSRWAKRVEAAHPKVPARQLYQGRGFREAEAAAAAAGADVYVISAGLGLIGVEAEVPSYSLTVAEGSADNVVSRLLGTEGCVYSRWWEELQRSGPGTPFADLVDRYHGLILIGAGSSYLKMISAELNELGGKALASVRIFTAASPDYLPSQLKSCVMPYDARLEALGKGRAGTVSDFAQRAMRHFVEQVLPSLPGGGLEEHSAAVLRALEGRAAPSRKRGRSLPDGEILSLIRGNWAAMDGKCGTMHRHFRDSLGVACEQNRFKKLFAVVRSEKGRM